MRKSALAAAAVIFIGGPAVSSPSYSEAGLTEDQVRSIVERVISERPDLIISSLQDYEARQTAEKKADALSRAAVMMADPAAPRLGNASAPPSGILFLDYNCGHCRNMHPEISLWLNASPGRSLVVAELPILGQGSVAAARAALAGQSAGVYDKVSAAFFSHKGPITPDNIATVLRDTGVDADALIEAGGGKDIEEVLVKNMRLATDLGVTGTPAILIGDEVRLGEVSASDLDEMVAR